MMKQRFFSLLFALLLLPCLVLCARAAQTQYVIDHADLLNETEEKVLEDGISRLRNLFDIDIVILTEESLQGARPQDHADHFYDSQGYREDGLLFLLSMEERDWYITTSGDAVYALTDYGIQSIGEEVVPYLAAGSYYEAFDAFLAELYDYFGAFQDGAPVDGYADYSGDYYHADQDEVIYYEEPFTPSFGLALFIGIAAAGITVLIMRIGMNTKRPQKSAAMYMDQDSYRVTEHRDMFLYSNVSKVRKQQSSSSGGGSSVHRSSGNRSHGGGGGKF